MYNPLSRQREPGERRPAVHRLKVRGQSSPLREYNTVLDSGFHIGIPDSTYSQTPLYGHLITSTPFLADRVATLS